ncbi:MAG: hypothetical protein JST12_01215 [Armatimonadetes bacterium]|nr:hypothetical protein [Armatimonadota bacterium]
MPTRSIAIVLGCVIGGIGLGFLFGVLIGTVAPDFCSVLLVNPAREAMHGPHTYNSQQLGIGLGLANGAWIGLIAGVGIVIGEAIKSLKKP